MPQITMALYWTGGKSEQAGAVTLQPLGRCQMSGRAFSGSSSVKLSNTWRFGPVDAIGTEYGAG